jgi:hypothetical protein
MAEQEKEFRGVVVSLSEALKEKETNILVYTHCLPMEYNDKKPLTVLQLMHNRDLFSATNPDRLATLMKEINRIDLAKIVEKYTRKTRKGAKSRTQLDSATAAADVDSSLFVSLQAKLEVTSIQSVITAKALDEALKTVKTTPLKRVEEIMQDAKAQADKLRNLVSRAQRLYHLSRSTPQSNGARSELPLALPHEEGNDDDNDIYSNPCFDGVESKGSTKMPNSSDLGEYVAMYTEKTTSDVSTSQPESAAAQMVTGLSGRGIKPEKPAIRPKPTKTRSEGNSSGLITTPPVIGANEIQKRKSTLKRAGTTKPLSDQLPPESRSTNSSVDTADYTGGSCTGGEGTGEYTGDSGFGDARAFLKVNVTGSQSTAPRARPAGAGPSSASGGGYYKTLGTPDLVEGYTTVTGKSANQEDELYDCPADVVNDVTYVNVTRTLH